MTLEELGAIKAVRRLKKDEKEAYCQFWQSSGLSKKAFCQREGIVMATFLSWFKIKSVSRKEAAVGFLAVELVSHKGRELVTAKPLHIELPNGLRITGEFAQGELSIWLKEVSDAISSLF